MSLYTNWTDMVVEFVKEQGEDAFWQEYGAIEKNIYTKILALHSSEISGSIKELAEKCDATATFFMGFLDGINDSLITKLDLEALEEDSSINLNIDFSKLYFNMLEAKADYLYDLPQWEGIFSKERRKEIHKEWAASKTVVNKTKTGRNEPCTCGSGKKYKNCCGKNA